MRLNDLQDKYYWVSIVLDRTKWKQEALWKLRAECKMRQNCD